MSDAGTVGQVPRRLAEALLAGMHRSRGALQVGSHAADVDPVLIPDGVIAIGAAVRDGASTSVFVAPLSQSSAREAFRVRLLAAGYEEISLGQGTAVFVSEEREQLSLVWCRGTEAVMLVTHQDAEPGCLVLLMVQRGGNGPCSKQFRTMQHVEDDAPTPTLRLPPGVRSEGGGSSGGGDRGRVFTVRCRYHETPSHLHAYLTAQLVEQGWLAGPKADDDEVMTGCCRRVVDGRSWSGVLTVVRGAPWLVSFHLSPLNAASMRGGAEENLTDLV